MSRISEIDAEGGVLEGRYANYLQVGHNAFEVVFDFGQRYADAHGPALHTRIVIHPAYLKSFLAVLADALDAYQRTFGELPDPD